jgi:hypothetical protein
MLVIARKTRMPRGWPEGGRATVCDARTATHGLRRSTVGVRRARTREAEESLIGERVRLRGSMTSQG